LSIDTLTEDEQFIALSAEDETPLDLPYEDGGVQEDYGTFQPAVKSFLSQPPAPNSMEEAAAFLRNAHDGPLQWKQLCLKLQRIARGLPAVYPSALAAAEATPRTDRVYRVEDLRRGMVAYSDNPVDSNPFGHVYFIAGRDAEGRVLTWTNDALRSGGCDLVPLDFYQKYWNYTFQFGAVSLNGYDFSDLNEKPKPKHPTLGANYNEAVERVEKAIRYHKDAGHPRVVRLLKGDLEIMKKRQEQFS
jgi:hypothetical protein